MLKQKFLTQFGSTLIIRVVALIAGIIVARIAGPEVIGTIAFGTAYVSLWSFVNGLFSTGHIKMISEGKDLGSCVTTYSFLQGGSMVLYFILVSGWFIIQKYFFNYPFESVDQQLVIIILLFATIATLILDFNNVTFTAKLKQAKANYPLFVKSIIWQIGRIIIVLLGFKAVALAGWNLVVTVILLPLSWSLYKSFPRGKYDRTLAKKYWSYVPPIALVVITNNILNYSDKLLLSYYTNVTELGYYTAAFSIGGMFLLVSKATGQIFFPFFSQKIAEKDWHGINQKIHKYQDFAVLFILPAVCVFAIAGEPFIISLLGNKYQSSIIPFQILLFATFISIVGMPYGNIISGMGRFYLSALINVIRVLIFIVSLTVFVSPKFLDLGAVGLAFNLLTINIVGNILYLYFGRRLGELKNRGIQIIRYLITGIILLLIFILRNYMDISNTFGNVILLSVIFLVIFYGSFSLVGLIKYDHYIFFLDIIKVRSLIKYIKDELGNRDND